MKIFTTGFGIHRDYEDNQNYLAESKDIANRECLETITKFIMDNLVDSNKIFITASEWVRGIPYEEAPDIIPFNKTFILEVE